MHHVQRLQHLLQVSCCIVFGLAAAKGMMLWLPWDASQWAALPPFLGVR